jgi:hypothetical protein
MASHSPRLQWPGFLHEQRSGRSSHRRLFQRSRVCCSTLGLELRKTQSPSSTGTRRAFLGLNTRGLQRFAIQCSFSSTAGSRRPNTHDTTGPSASVRLRTGSHVLRLIWPRRMQAPSLPNRGSASSWSFATYPFALPNPVALGSYDHDAIRGIVWNYHAVRMGNSRVTEPAACSARWRPATSVPRSRRSRSTTSASSTPGSTRSSA